LSNNAYTGHSFERENLPSLKLVAYADGIALGMSSFEDFQIFHQAYQDYHQATDAKLNYHKTIAFPLNGKISQDWLSHLSSHGITHWHSETSNSTNHLSRISALFPHISA
jgi:hypothetical protein